MKMGLFSYQLAVLFALGLFASQSGLTAAADIYRMSFAPRQTAEANNASTGQQPPLACDVNALNREQRSRLHTLVMNLRAKTQRVEELENGYALALPADGTILREAGEYVSLERQCCPFFDFGLESRREGGPVWLILTGREGVKDFAKIEFAISRVSQPGSYATKDMKKESPLVCNDGALGGDQARRLGVLLKELRAHKSSTVELADGYAIELPAEAEILRNVAEYMSILRICSPYFETTLKVGCEGGSVWLNLSGREGVKPLVKEEFKIAG